MKKNKKKFHPEDKQLLIVAFFLDIEVVEPIILNMATKEKRHVCRICKRKLVESKMNPVCGKYRGYRTDRTAWECIEKCY